MGQGHNKAIAGRCGLKLLDISGCGLHGGLILTFEQTCRHFQMSSIFEWRDISLTLKQNTKQRKLLSHIDGYIKCGQLLGIQGPSGCGKTSLINSLTGKVIYSKNLTLEGSILLNNSKVNAEDFDRKIVCVSQTDQLFSYLTVRDTLLLSAAFHLPFSTPRHIIEEKVDNSLRLLGLTKVSETILGSSTRRGVSGGEYKRVMIGKEMMKDPQIVFVDEPTSGLDAFQALAVMEAMKVVADSGKMVIAVVHQPRSSIFSLFDNLLLMTEGKCIYFGPAKRVLHYLERLGYPCPEHYNPADFYLDLMSVDFRTADLEVESRIRIDHLILEWSYNKEHFRNHDMQEQSLLVEQGGGTDGHEIPRRDMQMIIRPISMPIFQTVDRRGPSIQQPEESTLEQAPRDIRTVRKSCPEWIGDFIRLSWRASVEILRNYGSIAIKTATSLFFAVILSLVYHGIGFSQRNIQDRIGVLYFILVNQVGLQY